MLRAVVVMGILSGCLHPDTVDCSNGITCPVALVCDVAHDGCVAQSQIDACTGLPDLAPCQAAQVPNGVCHEGVCLPASCGNGRIDPPEVCDDGNTIAGDGCSADCLSNETCGNGVVDFIDGEQCDDGNRMSRDGCSSSCVVEVPQWTRIVQVVDPVRVSAAYAYDEVRLRAVELGGAASGVIASDTIEWNGNAWVSLANGYIAPEPRAAGAAVFDAELGKVMMFGGNDGASTLADTWLWDGEHWTDVTTPDAPTPRFGHAMAYDAAHHGVLLFGGLADATSGDAGDTWWWDGTSWTQVGTTGDQPWPRSFAAMGYDPVREQVVLYGGAQHGSTVTPLDDTWTWDGQQWKLEAGPSAGARSTAALDWDSKIGALVMTGGSATDPTVYVSTGAGWTVDSTLPVVIGAHAAWFDRVLQASVIHGGVVGAGGSGAMYVRTGLLGSGAWKQVSDPAPPPLLEEVGLTYDERRGVFVLFGGYDGTTVSGATWELRDGTWQTPMVMGSPPGPRQAPALAYDPNASPAGMSYLYGGSADTHVYGWDGITWEMMTTSSPPPPARAGAAMVYDDAIGAVVMFGGITPDVNHMALGDTYAWDGANWQLLAADGDGPGARTLPMMAYDRRRQVITLFGGGDQTMGTEYDDTWEWNGSWKQLSPVASPPRRVGGAMTYDPVRGLIVLFGGSANPTVESGDLQDVWSWDGTVWTRVATLNTPSPRALIAMAYDALGESLVVFGSDFGQDPATYRLGFVSSNSLDACGTATDRDGDGLAGCADPDCWGWCTPLCAPLTSCPANAPTCGDGTDVHQPLETCRSCPADAGACPPMCGDFYCDPGETAASCPGDCM